MTLETFFSSGLAIDLVLVCVVLEVLLLGFMPRLRGSLSWMDIASLILPGVMLMLTIRNALTGGPYTMTAVYLTAAFAFHLFDVARRRRA